MDIAIKGNQKNGNKIIKYLESLGGYNCSCYSGTAENYYYYIDKNNDIGATECNELPGYKYLLEIPITEKSFELWTY